MGSCIAMARRGTSSALTHILAVAAMMFLCVGLTGAMILISDVALGGMAPTIAGDAALVVIAGLWFVLRSFVQPRNPARPGMHPRAPTLSVVFQPIAVDRQPVSGNRPADAAQHGMGWRSRRGPVLGAPRGGAPRMQRGRQLIPTAVRASCSVACWTLTSVFCSCSRLRRNKSAITVAPCASACVISPS